MKKIPERNSWDAMRARCTNVNHEFYSSYGGRGISICGRWENFDNFLADMGPRPSPTHSLDRKDNDGNYEPGNCRWATKKEQMDNRRNNRLIEFDGQTHTMADWSRIKGMRISTLHQRIMMGWSVEAALNQPTQKRPPNSEWNRDAIKLTEKQKQHLFVLSDGERSSYPGLHLNALNGLLQKGLVTARHDPGSMFSPANNIIWRITDAGRGYVKAAPQRTASRPIERRS